MTAWLLVIGIPLLVGMGCGSLSRTFMNASWRDRWQQPEVVVHSLALQSGNHVADLGAGGATSPFVWLTRSVRLGRSMLSILTRGIWST